MLKVFFLHLLPLFSEWGAFCRLLALWPYVYVCVCVVMLSVYVCVCVLHEAGVLRGQMLPCRSLEEQGKWEVMSFALVAWVQERRERETAEREQDCGEGERSQQLSPFHF